MNLWTNWAYAFNFETIDEDIKYLKQLQELDELETTANYLLAIDYRRLYQYDKAIAEIEKSMEIYKKFGSKPTPEEYYGLGNDYHKTGQLKKEKKLIKKAGKELPDNYKVIMRQVVVSLTEGDMVASNMYIKKFKSSYEKTSFPESDTTYLLALIYSDAGFPDKAEEYYRIALTSDPDSIVNLNNLARFLIDNDRNVIYGLELANKALELNPDDYSSLACKGWALFKMGKYEEALELLEKSWKLKPVYDHDLFLHIEEVKKTMAIPKNIKSG